MILDVLSHVSSADNSSLSGDSRDPKIDLQDEEVSGSIAEDENMDDIQSMSEKVGASSTELKWR